MDDTGARGAEGAAEDRALDALVDRLLRGEPFELEEWLRERGELGAEFAARARRLARVLGRAGDGEPAAQPPLAVGTALGDYRLLRILGRGGMGTVYVAEQRGLGRLVALKTLHPELAPSPTSRERLTREALAIARLRHPGIVQIHAAGEERGVAYLAMELVPGAGLDEHLRGTAAEPRLSTVELVRCVRDVARALEVSHAAGIVHRDVKPSNVRVTPEGRAVLIDFGLALAGDWRSLTRTGHFRGTPHYAAPEQVDPALGPVDARSDVYSLGATLYECATGSAPFTGSSTQQVFHQILNRDAPPPRRLQPTLSRDLENVILRAMARERAHRYAGAGALAGDLDALLEGRPVSARPLGPGARLARLARRRPAALAAIVLALVLFGVVPLLFAVHQRRTLQRVLRLSDTVLLGELERRADELWPRRPERAPAMRAWLDEARALVERTPLHRRDLVRLRALDGARREALEVRWQLGALEELVAGLQRLPDRLQDVEQRLRVAERVVAATVADPAERWAAVARRVASSEVYTGLQLAPQLGLVPLEADPESGLWEFLVWETGEPPGTDPRTGRWRVADETGIVLVLLPGGEAGLGSQSADRRAPFYYRDPPPGEVRYTTRLDPFLISKYELTQGQWLRLTGSNPSQLRPGADFTERILDPERPLAHPVEQVSWVEARDALARIGLELPTDAQWEYAARGGTTSVRWFGGEGDEPLLAECDNLADRAALAARTERLGALCEDWDDGWAFHAPVGCFEPNPFGLHDTLGNLREWCLERFTYPVELQPGTGARQPAAGAPQGSGRIVRGGSYTSPAAAARSALRTDLDEEAAVSLVGLRPVRRLDPAP